MTTRKKNPRIAFTDTTDDVKDNFQMEVLPPVRGEPALLSLEMTLLDTPNMLLNQRQVAKLMEFLNTHFTDLPSTASTLEWVEG
jgi:hypothetical protein